MNPTNSSMMCDQSKVHAHVLPDYTTQIIDEWVRHSSSERHRETRTMQDIPMYTLTHDNPVVSLSDPSADITAS